MFPIEASPSEVPSSPHGPNEEKGNMILPFKFFLVNLFYVILFNHAKLNVL